MSRGEKRFAVLMVVVLIAMIAVYFTTQPSASNPPGGPGVKTQEFGKAGAKVEILAVLPITHGCHVNTEAELKKAYEKHPEDIHLTIVDLFGPDAPKYLPKVGNRMRAVVSINGKSTFSLDGTTVQFEQQENMAYRPAQITAAIEQELKAR